jgi:hypothetical protein
VGVIRFFVVFLLGIGAALGAYATGTLDYMSRQHYFRSWSEPGPMAEHDMVLRVSGNALNGACTARYAVDNRSGRRVFVVFAPEAGPADARFASYDRQRSYGYEGPTSDRYESNAYGSYAGADEEFRPAESSYHRDYGDRHDDPRYAQELPPGVADDQAPPPVEVAPGEKKILGRADTMQVADADGSYGPEYDAAEAGEACGDDHIVRLQITDCAAGDGACVAAMNSPGGANP